jgi:AAA+ superfamily predicted ATPase
VAPEDATLRQLLASRLAERGRFEEAADEYRAAIRLLPKDAQVRLALANVFLAAGQSGAAEMAADDALRVDPYCGPGHLLRARALLAQGKASEAISAYGVAVTIDSSLADEALAVRLGFAAPVPGPAPTQTESPKQADSKSDRSDTRTTPPADHRSTAPSGSRRPDPEPSADEIDPDGLARSHAGATSGRDEGDDQPDPSDPLGILERPRISFADVGGMEPLKEEIRLKILYPHLHPELYKAYGKQAGGGILLFGAPGCGKTHIARATAGELGAAFVSVGIADVLDMWVGSSERNLRAVFNVARSHAPSVLFFDEVDALAASRSDFRSSSARHVINQFLAEMDGADASNEGVLIIGATNAPWHMDSAFRRPGRFDQIVFVPPPDRGARIEILRVLLRERPAPDVDLARVADATDGYSGADLMGIVNRAVESKLAAALRDGIPRPIVTEDLLKAVRSLGPTTREWFSTVRNYVLYSNESGIYDPVRPYLKNR